MTISVQRRSPLKIVWKAAITVIILAGLAFKMDGIELFASAVPACPAPRLDTASWPIRTVKVIGIRLRLPKRYKEASRIITIGGGPVQSYEAGGFDVIDVEVETHADPALSRHKLIRQADYTGYTECVEMVGGREVIIQSFRGGGVIIEGGRQFPSFHVEAIWQLNSARLVRISSQTASRESQAEILAMLRTIEFVDQKMTD